MRDFLLRLAEARLYTPRWSKAILHEWRSNLLRRRSDLTESKLEWTIREMNRSFPLAVVDGYEPLTLKLLLPDKNDRHVLAAAIASGSSVIVTTNLRDFPITTTGHYGIAAVHPDDFCVYLLASYPVEVVDVFIRLVNELKNPPMSRSSVLSTLKKAGLQKTVAHLEHLIENQSLFG